MSKKTEWNKKVMALYRKRLAENPNYTLKEAMIEAKRLYK